MSDLPILELRHIECEPPGTYQPTLEKYGPVHTVRLWKEPVPADPGDFAAILVMGGPMGANDGGALPWIDDEVDFLRRGVEAGAAIWGVCLGAQLLAAALGARVYTGAVPEVGVVDVTLTDAGRADPVWGEVGDVAIRALQWHSDTFDLPPSATLLARSTAYPHQLFRAGRFYGVQFHLEADVALAREWLRVPEYRAALETAIGAAAVPDFISAVAAAETYSAALATSAMSRWLDLVLA